MSHERHPVKTYVIVYIALMILLALTVEAARHNLGAWNFLASFSIAVAKTILIGLFFMHLKQSTHLVRLAICGGLLWLAIMFSLSMTDYSTRGWDSLIGHPNSQSTRQ